MSRQYASQLLFNVTVSKTYQHILVLCILLSLVSIYILEMDLVFKILMFISLIYISYNSIKINTVSVLQWQKDGSWLITQNNQTHKAKLKSGSVVTPYFASLNFVFENDCNKTVLLFADNIDIEKFRQFRVRMKVEGIKA